jgi:hypothetical protein
MGKRFEIDTTPGPMARPIAARPRRRHDEAALIADTASPSRPKDGVVTIADFSDVVVVPYSELLHEPHGAFHRGGPIWPEWDRAGIERHWVGRQPYDDLPIAPDAVQRSNRDDLFWAGAICRHFGHQIMDFSLRIVPARAAAPDAAFLFAGREGKPLPPFFPAILDWLDVPPDRRVILERPTRFPRLRAAAQPEWRET